MGGGGGGGGGGIGGIVNAGGGVVGKALGPYGQTAWDEGMNALDPMDVMGRGNARKQAEIAQMERELGPRPEMAAYKSPLAADGRLSSKYKVATGGTVKAGSVMADKVKADKVTAGRLDTKALAADPRALNAMRDRALSQGDSPWLKMQTQKQGLEEMGLRDQAAQQAMSGAAMGRSQLAMKGGLGGGASARLAMSSARDANAARQAIGRQGVSDRLGLGIADDQTKMGLLGQTAGLDLSHAQQAQDMGKFNIGTALDASKTNASNNLDASKSTALMALDANKTNVANRLGADVHNDNQAYDASKTNTAAALGGLSGENQFNMSKYGNDMSGYAAGKQGIAIAKGGVGGSGPLAALGLGNSGGGGKK